MAVVDAALPDERLTEDEIGTILFDDPEPTCLFGIPGTGVAAGVLRPHTTSPNLVHVQVVAVTPDARRRGAGAALLGELHRWAFDDQRVTSVVAGGGAPFYLWPGIDVNATGALCMFESLGYDVDRGYLDLTFPSRFRSPVPEGVEVRRVLCDADADSALAFVAAHWPTWVAECRRGIEHGACHIAVAASRGDAGDGDGDVVGFGCHSVNRLGVLGPIGTHPARRDAGVGSAVMSAIATDVMVAGLDEVRVSWIGPYRFYAKAAGASTARAYLSYVLRRPAAPSA